MSYIDLQEGVRSLGRATLPATVCGDAGDKFDVRRAVRSGGNGVVFESLRLKPKGGVDRRCALKVLRRQDAARIDRFGNEARVLRELGSHPRVAPYYDHGTVRLLAGNGAYDVPWIAMELGGDNLRDHVVNNGPIAPDALIRIGIELCEAIGHLHSNSFIHRDVKPANLVWEDKSSGDILLIDMGIAKRAAEDVSGRPLDNFTRHGEFVGPVFFSSPELIAYSNNPQHPVDFRSDLFQIGKVLWYLATGKISAGVPAKRDCPMGGALRDLVLELIADDPDDRPQNAQTVIASLHRIKQW